MISITPRLTALEMNRANRAFLVCTQNLIRQSRNANLGWWPQFFHIVIQKPPDM